jgi:hypothetical protein
MAYRQFALTIATIFATLLLGSAVKADVIDGDWCHDDGRHFSIKGPTIITPAGQETQGKYTRHSFRYTVPAGVPEAGLDISMLLLNELTVSLQPGADGTPQIWHRCKPTTS